MHFHTCDFPFTARKSSLFGIYSSPPFLFFYLLFLFRLFLILLLHFRFSPLSLCFWSRWSHFCTHSVSLWVGLGFSSYSYSGLLHFPWPCYFLLHFPALYLHVLGAFLLDVVGLDLVTFSFPFSLLFPNPPPSLHLRHSFLSTFPTPSPPPHFPSTFPPPPPLPAPFLPPFPYSFSSLLYRIPGATHKGDASKRRLGLPSAKPRHPYFGRVSYVLLYFIMLLVY